MFPIPTVDEQRYGAPTGVAQPLSPVPYMTLPKRNPVPINHSYIKEDIVVAPYYVVVEMLAVVL